METHVRVLDMVAVFSLMATQVAAQSSPRQDAMVNSYFSIWDQDRNVTLENVRHLYASHLIYYGHPMTPESLLRDKLDFIRRWPVRSYTVEPGSASRNCDADENRCVLTVTLDWRTSGPSGTRAGRSRLKLALARENGALKIVRESAVTLGRKVLHRQ